VNARAKAEGLKIKKVIMAFVQQYLPGNSKLTAAH
jgi:hypothetical protein